MEYSICEMLGRWHQEYIQLSRKERRAWQLFFILKGEKERYLHDKARREAEQRRPKKAGKSSSSRQSRF